MRIGDLVNVEARWVTWESTDGFGKVGLKITPKSGGLEKTIAKRSVTTKVGRKGKMEVRTDHRLALKLLIADCLHDMRYLENDDGTPYVFSVDSALDILWNGPSELLDFFEDETQQVTEDTAEGNGEASVS